LNSLREIKNQTATYFRRSIRMILWNISLKVANIRCFIQIAVEMFHNIIRMERRKYVAVWFFISRKEFNVYQHDIHIFMNMIIWPLMTYTMTSFGKAFAHVRNCLLKKSTCYEIKILTYSTRKRHRRIQQDLCKN
jgi:hypothetical protein